MNEIRDVQDVFLGIDLHWFDPYTLIVRRLHLDAIGMASWLFFHTHINVRI
jgi:hypothetical protein